MACKQQVENGVEEKGHPRSVRLAIAACCLVAAFQVVLHYSTTPVFVEQPTPLNNRPIIGVLTVPLDDAGCVSRRRRLASRNATSCFHAPYVKWLESAGARVVPIPYDSGLERIKHLASSVSGIVFTGGDTPIRHIHSEYMSAARFLLDFVIETNDRGIYFPLWGTCMGIQVLSVLVGGPNVLEYHVFSGVDPRMMNLDLTPAATRSRMFSEQNIPPDIKARFQHKNVTTNFHHDGVSPESFRVIPSLRTFFRVLSTNRDQNGRSFVSTIEALDYPIYGVQWHPERPQFHYFAANDPVNHDLDSILCNAWTALFFVKEARRNAQRFPSLQEEEAELIYNYAPEGHSANQIYLF